MPRRPPSLASSPVRSRRRIGLAIISIVGLFAILWGGREWWVLRCLASAREELARDPIRAEQIVAESTLFWSWQRDTAWILRGRCCLLSHDIPEAYGCWSNVAQPQQASQTELLAFAEAALTVNETRLAEWAITAAERGHTRRREWLIQRLSLSLRNQAWDRVVGETEELIRLADDDGPSWLVVGDAHYALSRFPLAEEAYRRAAQSQVQPLTLNQLHAMRPRWLQLLVDLGEWETAAPLAERELADHPADSGALRCHATILRSHGRTAEALAAIVATPQVMPGDERNLILHATLLIDLQRDAEAAAILRPLIEQKPFSPEPRHRYAGILRRQNRSDEAVIHEREARRLSQLQRNFLDRKSEWNVTQSPKVATRIAEILRQLGRAREAPAWEDLAKRAVPP